MNRKTVSIGVLCLFIGLLFSSNIIADKQDTEFIEYSLVSYDSLWEYNSSMGGWCIEFPAVPINDSIVWSTEILDAYVAYLSFTHFYDFESYYFYNSTSDEEFEYESKGYLELSADDGNTWYILGLYSGDIGGNDSKTFDISYWAFNEILIRFRVEGVGDDYFANESGGFWCFWDLKIYGMVDNTPPQTDLTTTGIMYEFWYGEPPTVVIEASDDSSGVKEIHYILNGEKNVILGDYCEFKINSNGIPTIEYWAIDFAGNEENPHNYAYEFGVDLEEPTIQIIEPSPGIYLFGRKIIPSDNIIILGSFDIKADAQDNLSGISNVHFLIDDELIYQDFDIPYEMNCDIQNIGKVILKVSAYDNVFHFSETQLDIYYYNFF